MSRFIVVLVLFFVIALLRLEAQTALVGTVTDTLGMPVAFANVYVKQSDTSLAIIAFCISDLKGYYSLELLSPYHFDFVVVVSALGYEEEKVQIRNNEEKLLEINFKLSEKTFHLKEVNVVGDNKIIQKNDTITFDADRFRDSTENNLEELLSKIPGVEIDKHTGVISIQGKPIKKILIEGDDLTGHNYQLMSKNMSADVVDKIQIIDRFTENKLLKGITHSEDKAINIILKEGRKKLLFGNIIASIGNQNRTNNSLNLFGFYNKFKTVSFGNYNNIGLESTADLLLNSRFSESNDFTKQHSLLKSLNPSLIDIRRSPPLSLNSQSVRFNRAAFGSTYFVTRPVETISIKGGLIFSQDRVKSFIENQYRYSFVDSSTFLLTEFNTIEKRPFLLEAHLDIQIDLNKKSTLRYKTDARKAIVDNFASTIANDININNYLRDKTLAFSNQVDFTYLIKTNQALILDITLTNDHLFQNLVTDQNQQRTIPTISLPLSRFQQEIKKPLLYFSTYSKWLLSRSTLQMSAYAGYTYRKENLLSMLSVQNQNNVPELDSFKNQIFYSQTNPYTGLDFRKKWLAMEWFLDISGGYHQSSIVNKINESAFYSLPTIGFKKEIKAKHHLFGTYGYNYALPQAVDLSDRFILTDYRSLQQGSRFFIPENSHTLIFNYTNGNFEDDFLWYINLLNTVNTGGYRSSIEINENFNTLKKVENDLNIQNTVISGSLEKYMPNYYMRIKLRPTFIVGKYPNTLNNMDIRDNNMFDTKVNLSLRSAYIRWFNFHLGTTLARSIVSTTIAEDNNVIKNKSLGCFLDFLFRSDRVMAKLENELFYFQQQDETVRKYYFTNASINYTFIKTKLFVSMSGKNLLNTEAFINSFITDFSTQINKTRLLPRYLLIEVNYRF